MDQNGNQVFGEAGDAFQQTITLALPEEPMFETTSRPCGAAWRRSTGASA